MSYERDFKDLPEGWKWVRLGEVIEEAKEKNKLNKNLPILTSSRKGIYLQDEYFNRIVASKDISNYKMIKKGEFTYRSMSDDETFVFNRLEDIPVGLVSPAYFVFQVKEGYSGDYLKYLLNNSVEIKRQIYKEIKGTTRVALKFNQLTNFIVPLPPLPEQQKIAEILETIDNAIEKTDKIIEKYKRIKQGLMQDLLTKGIDENGNIRNEKTHKFKDSPLGRIPEEWEVVRLGEVCDIRISNVDKKIVEKEKKVMLCNYLDVYKNDYITKSINFMIGTATKREIDKFNVLKGDVIITKDSEEFYDIAKPSYVSEKIPNLVCGYHLAMLRPKNTVNGLFLSKALKLQPINIFFQKRANGITRFGITKETIENALIPLPPLPEQQRIAEILSQIDQTIEKEKQYKEKLQKIKQGLMQDLLTGKVRVNHLVEEEEK